MVSRRPALDVKHEIKNELTCCFARRFDMDELLLPDHAPMPKREDETRMRAAVDRIHGLIQKELDRGIDSDRIVLAGFSQGALSPPRSSRRRTSSSPPLTVLLATGCATTLLSGLSWSEGKLGGLMCLSGWLPMAYDVKKQGSSEKHPVRPSRASLSSSRDSS